jgi:hypothetical protein
MDERAVRWFRYAVYGWTAAYLVAILLLGPAAGASAPVKGVPLFTGALDVLPVWGCAMLSLVTVLFAWQARGVPALIAGLLVWWSFGVLAHRMWLASNGGVQLMSTMLLWCAWMPEEHSPAPHWRKAAALFAFWAARLQLLLVYAVAAAHKYMGHTWPEGSAFAFVAADPTFDLGVLAQAAPMVVHTITWTVLVGMTLFPLAVWWGPSRRVVLVAGMLFHAATAFWMDIPQMGLAFIACYPIWTTTEDIARSRRCLRAERNGAPLTPS